MIEIPTQIERQLKIAFILPGLGRVHRGAETAFLELAKSLNKFDDLDVQLFGGGSDVPADLKIHTIPLVNREKFERYPRFPIFRSENEYEEFSFISSLILRKRKEIQSFDAAIHCSFPFTNWFLRALEKRGGPRSIFITQNGDWTCRAESREYRTFHCSGLVCTKPEFYDRHKDRYRTELIPNGVDPTIFIPRKEDPSFIKDPRIPGGMHTVLMVSAFIPSKRVLDGIRSVAAMPNAFLVLAGDGPQRVEVANLLKEVLPGRHLMLGSVRKDDMPKWYRQADIFLHMSQDESFGIVYLEAASSGLAQVVHRTESTEWILGDSAVFTDTSKIESVAEGLRQLLDPETRSQMGTRARQRVLQDWTWDIQAAKYRKFLFETVRKADKWHALSHSRQLQHSRVPSQMSDFATCS
jgi:glycosyltransferase involved in cell wall biosynthesis